MHLSHAGPDVLLAELLVLCRCAAEPGDMMPAMPSTASLCRCCYAEPSLAQLRGHFEPAGVQQLSTEERPIQQQQAAPAWAGQGSKARQAEQG